MYLAKISGKNSKLFVKNICNQEVIDAFKNAGFNVKILEEVEYGDKRYFFEDGDLVSKPVNNLEDLGNYHDQDFKCPIGWSIDKCDARCFYMNEHGVCSLLENDRYE